MVDLKGRRPVPTARLEQMGAAMAHRGPDCRGLWQEPGVGIAFRGLELAAAPEEKGTGTSCRNGPPGASHKRCLSPFPTSDQDVVVALDGTLYDTDGVRSRLESHGHTLHTRSDAELVGKLWQQDAEAMFGAVQGQFALALWDRRRRRLILARDRFGICPLHWVERDGWLLFASEIKGLLASGMVEPRLDVRGLCQVFTFFGLPGPVTCFEGVSALLPGRFLEVNQNGTDEGAAVHEGVYWELDFPDRGSEATGAGEPQLLDQYEDLLLQSVRRRLGAGLPVAAYSSGGLDSSLLLAMANKVQGHSPPTLTFRIEHPTRDESAGAEVLSNHLGHETRVVDLTGSDLVHAFPPLVRAAESPVIDVSAAALFRLAEAAGAAGHKAVITGEGADEWQAGYPWFRIHKRVRRADFLPGARIDRLGFWIYAKLNGSPRFALSTVRRAEAACGGPNAWLLAYNLMSTTQLRFFSRSLCERLAGYLPYDDLDLPRERFRRWHPLSRSLYLGARVHLAGLHLHARGDRSAMHASVEPRYPFLDDSLVAFLAKLDPSYKMRGLEDKYLQRKLCERWLPGELTAGRKRLLHSPLEAFHRAPTPDFVEQLLSDESLRAAGYFDPAAVRRWRSRAGRMRHGFARLFVEMGLVGVISTQLWHHAYLDPTLADLPASPQPA